MDLDEVEQRVIGSLLEKERTVPATYPLTLNALRSACNQTSGRDPIMELAEHEIASAIDRLKGQGLARIVHAGTGARATKYRQVLDERLTLDDGRASGRHPAPAPRARRRPASCAPAPTACTRFDDLDEVDAALHVAARPRRAARRRARAPPGPEGAALGPPARPAMSPQARARRWNPSGTTGFIHRSRTEACSPTARDARDERVVDDLRRRRPRALRGPTASTSSTASRSTGGCSSASPARPATGPVADVGLRAGPDRRLPRAGRRRRHGLRPVARRWSTRRAAGSPSCASRWPTSARLPPPDHGDGWALVVGLVLARPPRRLRSCRGVVAAGRGRCVPAARSRSRCTSARETRHLDEWFGQAVDIDFTLHDPGSVLAAVHAAGLATSSGTARPLRRAREDRRPTRLYVLGRAARMRRRSGEAPR